MSDLPPATREELSFKTSAKGALVRGLVLCNSSKNGRRTSICLARAEGLWSTWEVQLHGLYPPLKREEEEGVVGTTPWIWRRETFPLSTNLPQGWSGLHWHIPMGRALGMGTHYVSGLGPALEAGFWSLPSPCWDLALGGHNALPVLQIKGEGAPFSFKPHQQSFVTLHFGPQEGHC